jgi:hypothetical protein
MINFEAIFDILNVQSTDHDMIPQSGMRVWRGAGTAGYNKDFYTATGRGDRLSYYCTQTVNIQHFDQRSVS